MKARANINLDQDAYDFASAYAGAKGIPLGAAVSDLLRQAERLAAQPASASRLKTSRRGYLVKARTGRKATPEMVRENAEDSLG
jgi:hypothetical protein